jgi:glycosyltransferase involved in cell wall biosynthesis
LLDSGPAARAATDRPAPCEKRIPGKDIMNVDIDETAGECQLTLFVACYCEEQGIIPSIRTAIAAAEEVGLSHEVIVVDDASTDGSVKLVKEFMAEHPQIPIKLIVNDVNQGVGANYVKAAVFGRGKYFRMICGDDVETKEILVAIFKRIGEADMILSYHTDTSARTRFRLFVSRAFTFLVNVLSGYRIKYYNGLAVHLRYNILRWHTNSQGFGFQAENITRLLGLGATYIEVGVPAGERAAGTSKAFALRNIFSVGHVILEIFLGRVRRILFPRSASLFKRNEAVFCTPAFEGRLAVAGPGEAVPAASSHAGQTAEADGA